MRDKLYEPDLIGVLLNGTRQMVEQVHFMADLRVEDFEDPQLRKAYDWILKAHEQQLDPTPKIIHTLSGKFLPLEWLETIAKDPPWLLDAELIGTAKMIVRASEIRATTRTLIGGLSAIEENRDVDEVKNELVDRLTHSRALSTKDSSMKAIHERILTSKGRTFLSPTNMPWLDDWLKGGLRSRRFIAVAGTQGGRKSTWVRNIVLAASRDVNKRVRDDVSVAWLAYENDQDITFYDFAVMCGVEWLRENGHWHKSERGMLVREYLDAEALSMAEENGKLAQWPPLAQQAARVGMERAEALPMHIYDAGEDTGNLTNQDNLWRCAKGHQWDQAQGKHLILVIDYAQLARTGNRLYEDMELIARDCLQNCRRMNCTIILLTQFNEDYNKDLKKGEAPQGYQGIKGGGDIKAGVHNLMVVSYDDANKPDKLEVKSGKARRGKTTAGHTYDIEPVSGLVLV